MDNKFHIILFKNNKKKKKLKSFVKESLAIDYYNKLLKKSSEIIFEKKIENGYECNFNIGIISNRYVGENIYFMDDFGRNRMINPKLDNDMYIQKISNIKVEELIFDFQINDRISFDVFNKKYISKDKILMISKIKNKFVIQNDDDYKLFSLKNDNDCDRFLDVLQSTEKRSSLIIVKDVSTIHRKYLYNLLIEKGFNKKFLYSSHTTYPR